MAIFLQSAHVERVGLTPITRTVQHFMVYRLLRMDTVNSLVVEPPRKGGCYPRHNDLGFTDDNDIPLWL